MSKIPMTPKGLEKLKQRLEHLKSVARPNVIKAIAEARAHGDLKENAEYSAAKEQQGLIEGEIRTLESKIANAQIIDIHKFENDGKVIFGATVQLAPVEGGNQVNYQIVGEDEADLKQGKISVSSPVARGLIGKYEGDTVEITTPKGLVAYNILQVEYL